MPPAMAFAPIKTPIALKEIAARESIKMNIACSGTVSTAALNPDRLAVFAVRGIAETGGELPCGNCGLAPLMLPQCSRCAAPLKRWVIDRAGTAAFSCGIVGDFRGARHHCSGGNLPAATAIFNRDLPASIARTALRS